MNNGDPRPIRDELARSTPLKARRHQFRSALPGIVGIIPALDRGTLKPLRGVSPPFAAVRFGPLLTARASSVRLQPRRQNYFFFPLALPPPRDLPASERLARQVPSWFRDRGCFPPPSSGTYGPFPARRSAMITSCYKRTFPSVADVWALGGIATHRGLSPALRALSRPTGSASFWVGCFDTLTNCPGERPPTERCLGAPRSASSRACLLPLHDNRSSKPYRRGTAGRWNGGLRPWGNHCPTTERVYALLKISFR